MELKKPCSECPLVTELLVSENTPQFSSMSDLLAGLTDKEYSLSCHKYTECGVVGEKEQLEDPPLCKGASLLKETIAKLEGQLNAHQRFHGKAGCPGGDACYVCAIDENSAWPTK